MKYIGIKDFGRKFTIYFIAAVVMMFIFIWQEDFTDNYSTGTVTLAYVLSTVILGVLLNMIYFNFKK